MQRTKMDIIQLTETWASEELLDSELFTSDFIVFRKDRKAGRGGGVLVAMRSRFSCSEIAFEEDPDLLKSNIDLS